jgi:hypothetical protein
MIEDFGFVWPTEAGAWRPSYIPLWLQEAVSVYFHSACRGKLTGSAQNLTDLGLPVNGSDGVFLNSPHWTG